MIFAGITVATGSNSNASAHVSPQVNGKSLIIIQFSNEVDPGAKDLFYSALSTVNSTNTAGVVVVLNSQGGLLSSMISIVDKINDTEALGIPVYTYIPQNGFATYAASYIALASTQIWMSPSSSIGSASPTEYTDQLIDLMDAMSSAHGRNVSAVNDMILNNTVYSASQAKSANLINGTATSMSDFLAKTNLAGYYQKTISESIFDQFISFISNGTVDGLFISFGSLAILLDIYHRTIFMTLLGLGLIILGFLGAQLIDASVVGIVFLLMGTALIFLEFKTGHGIALIAGIIVDVVGTLFLVSPNYDLSAQPLAAGYSPSPINEGFIVSAIIIILIGAFVAYYINRIVKSQVNKPVTGWESMIGKEAIADTDIGPTGWVSVDGIRWRSKVEGNVSIEKGETVIVVGINNLTLLVKRGENTERPGI
jgi:Membrane-bound serine protease (ClpP class)